MAWTNVTIMSTLDRQLMLDRRITESKLEFWENQAGLLHRTLENIPESVKQNGFVDIEYRGETIRLVALKEEETESHG